MEDKLKYLIKNAICMVYQNDEYLIVNGANELSKKDDKHHAGERSIVFRLAHYLQNLFDKDATLIFHDYNLDCEYNKNGAAVKALPSFKNGTYPDIIIHKRGLNDHNLLVIEVKTYWNRAQENDFKKMKEFTSTTGDYKYSIGMTILFEKKCKNVEIKVFKDGKITENTMLGMWGVGLN